jgi:nitronate monooxygenase
MSIRELLGVRHPLGNAGMAGVAGPELCAAVADAGGIGTLALGGATADEAASRVGRVRELTKNPFGVNFIAWMLGRDTGPLDAALEAGVSSVTLSFGDSAPYVHRIHDAGAVVLQQVQTVEGAVAAVEAGVDALIAQGTEAGGHTGQIPLLPLLPQVVDAARDVPVLAAGGIGDGRGLAAVLMLGASGALMGTRFIVADEAVSAWPKLPDQVLAASASDTVWTTAIDVVNGGGTSQWPAPIGARLIRTPFLEKWLLHEDSLAAQLRAAVAAPEERVGDDRDPTPAYAGPIAGMISRRESAADILASTISQAREVLTGRRVALGD